MESSISSDDRYSRLIALERMGIIKDYKRVRDKCVVVAGVGGVGSLAAESLTRLGIGRLILIDYDTVEVANMNRPCHVGLLKTEAAKSILLEINPDVQVTVMNINLIKLDDYSQFDQLLRKEKIDLVLACVDNYEARLSINDACCELRVPWMEAGVSEDALNGHIQLLIPGKLACYACAPPLASVQGSEAELKKEGVCAASLPTTIAIISGLLVQNSLKFLLQFGRVSVCTNYTGLSCHIGDLAIRANPDCTNLWCKYWQQELAGEEIELDYTKTMASPFTVSYDINNEYDIEELDEDAFQIETKNDIWDKNIEESDLEILKKKLGSLK